MNHDQHHSAMPPLPVDYQSLRLPAEVLHTCRTTGYELYKAGNYLQAELVCRGLVASDPGNWYNHSLLAATLQKMGRFSESMAQLQEGLRHLPDHPRLLALRAAVAQSAMRTAARLIAQDC